MDTVQELKTTKNLVLHLLKTEPETRNSDNFLYYRVLSVLGERNGIDIEKMSICTFLLNFREFKIPSFESVGRCRRKVQEQFPELASVERVGKKRKENEQIYKAFALTSGKGRNEKSIF